MRGKKIGSDIKAKVLAESYEPGCVITKLAKQYGISNSVIHSWRSEFSSSKLKSNSTNSNSDNGFVELSVTESKQLGKLQEASLKFANLTLVIQGQINSSRLMSIIKILEE